MLLLAAGYLLFESIFTTVWLGTPLCSPELDERIEGESRDAYRAAVRRIMDAWGEHYWRLEDDRLVRFGFTLVDNFWQDYEQMQWRAADRISEDTTIDGVFYPAPPYLDEVRHELALQHGPDAHFLQGGSVIWNCGLMAAVVLTPESYARYRAERGLPPLPALPPVPEPAPG